MYREWQTFKTPSLWLIMSKQPDRNFLDRPIQTTPRNSVSSVPLRINIVVHRNWVETLKHLIHTISLKTMQINNPLSELPPPPPLQYDLKVLKALLKEITVFKKGPSSNYRQSFLPPFFNVYLSYRLSRIILCNHYSSDWFLYYHVMFLYLHKNKHTPRPFQGPPLARNFEYC